MPQDVAAVVLAAGMGTRFRSDRAKVLHRAAGRTLVRFVLEALRPLDLGQIVVVVGHQAEEVAEEVSHAGLRRLTTALQAEQRGTGHAVQAAMPALAEHIQRVLIVPGDTPLLTGATLRQLLEVAGDGDADGLSAADAPGGALLTADLADPSGYGRVVHDNNGRAVEIVEERDATDEQRQLTVINAGMYLIDRVLLGEALAGLEDDNAQGELYLTDVVAALARTGQAPVPVLAPESEIAGVNDRRQLADAAAVLRRRHLDHLLIEVGVNIPDPAAVWLDVDVEVAREAVLLPGTVLEAGTRIGEGSVIGPDTHLTRCAVGPGASVHSTRAQDAVIGERCSVGPFSHLRAGTVLEAGAKVGAYVETKNVTVGERSKLPHLAYVGDATIGTGVNVACGVITVNYDGHTKSHTTIEDGAFIGCDTMLVAPVTIGHGAYTAAGSTITEDLPAGALGIARSRQTTKDGWAERRRAQRDEGTANR